MKKTLLFSAAMLLSVSAYAQQTLDMTPERFDFSKQEVGPFKISLYNNTVNTAIDYGKENNAADDGLLALCVGPAGTVVTGPTTDNAFCNAMQANLNIIDLGGTAGKVLCLKGWECTIDDFGPAATPAEPNGIFGNFSFLSKVSGATGSGIPVRVRMVYNVFTNDDPDWTVAYDGIFKLEASASSNAPIPVDNGSGYQNRFAPVDFFTDDSGEIPVNDGTKWRVLEFDLTVNESTGFPFRIKMGFQGNYFKVGCLLIKELTYTMNPTGEPAEDSWETYSTTSSVAEILDLNEDAFSVSGGQVSFAIPGNVYNISGMLVADAAAGETITLDRGIYVVKAGGKTEKLIVK